MPSSSAPPLRGTSALSPNMGHQYAIEGYSANDITQSIDLPTCSAQLLHTIPTAVQCSQQVIEASSTPVHHPSNKYGFSKVISERRGVKSKVDVDPHEDEHISQPATIFTASNTHARQVFPSQYHFDLPGNFATMNLPSHHNMNPIPEPYSPFLPDVEAFTNSYLPPVSSILPTVAAIPSSVLSATTQGQVNYQLTSVPVNMTSPQDNDGITQEDMVRFRSHFRESLNVAPDPGHLTPVNGLGTTGVSQISVPSTPSQSHRRMASDRSDPSTLKTWGKDGNSNDTSIGRSPTALSPFTTPQSTSEFTPNKQEKRGPGFDSCKSETGFTPLIKKQKSTYANNNYPHKKIRLYIKGSSTPTTQISTSNASFGPPLHPVKSQSQSTFVSSSNVQADSSNFGGQRHAPDRGKKFAFLALNPQHAESLRIQMEEQLPPEMLELVEIRTVASQAQTSSSVKQSSSSQPALAKPKKPRLIAFDEHHAENMRKSMSSQMLETVEIVLITQLQREVHPRPIIKLTTSHRRTAATSTSRGPLTEFHLFSSLPTELQHRIWSLTLPGPRTVHLTSPAHPGLEIFLPKCSPPITLQVCAQSRSIGLRTFKPAFENAWLRGAYTWFDFSQDVLRLGDGTGVEAAKKMALSSDPGIVRDRKRVRHLEIPMRIQHTRHMYKCLAALICLCPARGWPDIRTLTFTGEARNGGVPKRMPVIEVQKGDEEMMGDMIPNLVVVMGDEFRMIWEELWFMPDCGLKIVYLEEGEK